MRQLKKALIISAVCSALLLPSVHAEEVKKQQMPAPKADIFIVGAPMALPISLKYPAQITSLKNVKVVARVSGVLEEKFFQEGQKVKQGELLYKIEDSIYKAKVDAAKASVQLSQANLDNATRNWNRIQELFKSKVISTEKRDDALSSYEQAQASLALSKAQLNQALIDLNYTKVVAPISGVVGIKKVDVGDYVSPSMSSSLIEITQNEKVFVEFSMPLSDYTNIKNKLWSLPEDKKLQVSLEIDNLPTQKVGVVDFMDVNVNKATATVKMRAIVENSDNYLMPGSFVRVLLNDITQQDIITIPQKAVLQNPLGTIVFVEKDGVVSVKPVKIGRESGDKYVVEGGMVTSGDRVIINNFFRVKPGGNVQVDKIVNEQGK
jgi:membrane fusion protein (multidrug efflux system)